MMLYSIAGKQLGISEDELTAARRFVSKDVKTDAELKFVKKVLEDRGHLEDSDLEAVRRTGYGNGAIVELVANVALDIFANYTRMTEPEPLSVFH